MKNDISPILVTRPYLPQRQKFDELVDQIWSANYLTNDGPLLNRFANELSAYFRNDNLVLTVNGHSALEIALQSFGNQKGEVITTPFTFVSTTHAIKKSGLSPVFCDINKNNLTIDADRIEHLITQNTVAIMPVHVYGHPCDVDKIEKISKKYGVPVIYDAAHAFGVVYNSKPIVNYGDMSILSFHATKLFHSIEGGAVFYRNQIFGQLLKRARNFGIVGEDDVLSVGGNAKMNEFQAAMGILNLGDIDWIIAERKRITYCYRKRLNEIKGIKYFVPEETHHMEYNYSYMPVLIDEDFGMSRNQLYERLKHFNIYTRRYFFPLTCDTSCYKSNYDDEELSTARRIASEILCLPIFTGLNETMIDYVCDCILAVQTGEC